MSTEPRQWKVTQMSYSETDLYWERGEFVEKAAYQALEQKLAVAESALSWIAQTSVERIPCPDNKAGCLVMHYRETPTSKRAREALALIKPEKGGV